MRAKLPVREGFVDRDGVRLHYEIYGDGAKTMLFVPPWSIVHSRVYKAQLPWFSERFRCIAYDARGNGKSDRPDKPEAYSLENHVADALAVMDATGIRGVFDITLNITMEDLGHTVPERAESGSIFSAVRELGLKLETRRAPIKHLVVDEAEKVPTDN